MGVALGAGNHNVWGFGVRVERSGEQTYDGLRGARGCMLLSDSIVGLLPACPHLALDGAEVVEQNRGPNETPSSINSRTSPYAVPGSPPTKAA